MNALWKVTLAIVVVLGIMAGISYVNKHRASVEAKPAKTSEVIVTPPAQQTEKASFLPPWLGGK